MQGCRVCRVKECRHAAVQGAAVQECRSTGLQGALSWPLVSYMGTSFVSCSPQKQAGQGQEHFFRYVPVAYSFMVKAG